MKNIQVLFAVMCVFACIQLAQAQVTWTATTSPVQATIAGGPWTLDQGGPFSGPVTKYCSAPNTPTQNAAGIINTMQPFYFPYVTGSGSNLQGYFDYRPRNIDEATVAANSTDGGLTWRFQQQVENLTLNCPTSDTNSSGDDDGLGHPYTLSFGGASWLYLLDRRGGHIDSDGLVVNRLTPKAGLPLNSLPQLTFASAQQSTAGNLITGWTFANDTNSTQTLSYMGTVIDNSATINNSPAPSTGNGVAKPLGMDNNYTYNFGPTSATSATKANPVVLTTAFTSSTAPPSGSTVIVSGATGNWAGINGIWTVTQISTTKYSIPVNSTSFAGALTGTVSVTPFLVGSVTASDITQTAGSSTPSQENSWRVRGDNNAAGPNGTGNGWNTAAPQYTQGAEFDTSTVGFTNIKLQYDWFTTTHGVHNQQVQYTTDGVNWTNIDPATIGTTPYTTPGIPLVANENGFVNQITVDFTNVNGVNDNPDFGVRMVSAYDPTYTGAGAPTYTDAKTNSTVYNNNSGNWRFANVNFYSGVTPPPPTNPFTNTTGLINPDGILVQVPGTYPRQVLYVDKTLSGDTVFPASQQCGPTPSGKAANHDTEYIHLAKTSDFVHFTDLGAVSGLNDPTTVSYSGIRYMAPNGSLLNLGGGKWGLFFGGGNCLDGDSDGFHAIMYAESTDLMHWTVINGINNPIASVSTVTATDPVTNQSVTIPANPPVIGPTQSWFAGRVYTPNAILASPTTINLVFAGYDAGYSTELSNYRTIGQVELSSGSATLP